MTRHKIPGLIAELVYDEEHKRFIVEGAEAPKAEGYRVVHPTQYLFEVIIGGRCPSFPGWDGSIRGVEPPK